MGPEGESGTLTFEQPRILCSASKAAMQRTERFIETLKQQPEVFCSNIFIMLDS